MRKEVYKIAEQWRVGFVLIYLHVDLDVALMRNQGEQLDQGFIHRDNDVDSLFP